MFILKEIVMTKTIKLEWTGPYKFGTSKDDKLPPNESGVYIYTVQTSKGRLLAYVGESQTLKDRWADHTWSQLGGRYNLYDTTDLCNGISKTIYKCEPSEKVITTYAKEFSNLSSIAKANLDVYEWFYALVENDKNIRKSIEAAIYYKIKNNTDNSIAQFLQNDPRHHYIQSEDALNIKCLSMWPESVNITGLMEPIEYGKQ
jgi:hypothetical protein